MEIAITCMKVIVPGVCATMTYLSIAHWEDSNIMP